jgi:hypothetical protein
LEETECNDRRQAIARIGCPRAAGTGKEIPMKIDLMKEDVELLNVLLEKDLGETLVGIHHCKSNDYKDMLRSREKQVRKLLQQIKEIGES